MIHLQAMSTERYAMFLYEQNDEALAKEFITSSYWLYQDWGADAKALQLTQLYDFLKVNKSVIVWYAFFYFDVLPQTYLLHCIPDFKEK